MLQDLHKGVTALLRSELPEDIRAVVGISFATPGEDFPPPAVALPALNLFLYDIVNNTELRQSGAAWEPQGPPGDPQSFLRAHDPYRVTCHYVVTAWAREGAPSPEDDEFRLLGEAMRTLLRYRILPPIAVVGEFAARDYPIHVRALENGRLGSPGELWQALGGRPRSFFSYALTFALPVRASETSQAVVTEAHVKIAPKP